MLKDIANGVLITCTILAVSILIPVVGIFCSLLLPLPTLYYRIKLGRTVGALIPVIGLIILMVAANTVSSDMVVVAALFIIGFALGELIILKLSIEKTMLVTCGLVFLGGAFSLFIVGAATGQSLFADFSQSVAHNREFLLQLYQSMGMPAESIPEFTQLLDDIQHIVVRILPALVITTTLFIIWINLLLGISILKKKQPGYPAFGRLNLWKAPEYLVWGVITCGIMMLIPDDFSKRLGLNGLLTLLMAYFFQGIAIVSFFFEKKQVPRFARVILYATLVMQEVLLIVIVIGFIDVWVNFRKLETAKS